MNKPLICLIAGTLLTIVATSQRADALEFGNRWAARYAATTPWHGDYYHTAWGVPVALVVPPTASMHREMGWGVTQTSMYPLWHQFRRGYPETYETGGQQFLPTPRWPSHTDQFGVYYVRGPW